MKSITSRDNPFYKELKHLAGSSHALRRIEPDLFAELTA